VRPSFATTGKLDVVVGFRLRGLVPVLGRATAHHFIGEAVAILLLDADVAHEPPQLRVVRQRA